MENGEMINLSKSIRELSEIYDKTSQNTYISLYINRNGRKKKFLERRAETCKVLLSGEELKNFLNTMKKINKFLTKNINNIAIFASDKHHYFKCINLPIKISNSLIVDSSPYIRPLARIQDEWESFTLVLLSSQYAKISSISLGKIEKKINITSDIINKHKKGGWSQARFNRIRKGAVKAFLSEVSEALKKMADKNIIISGPGTTKIRFIEILPKELKKRIVDVINISIEDEQKLLKESFQLISDREKKQSHEAVSQLKQEILKDGLAVYGLFETLDAVKNGQVDLLIIEKDYKKQGWICEHCQVVKEGKNKTCPYCNNKTSEVDIVEEILEFAERTNTNIEFTDGEEIANLGHVGAILRFK